MCIRDSAHALIEEINTDIARKVPGIECIFTYKDVPQKRFTMAGQTFPEPVSYTHLGPVRRTEMQTGYGKKGQRGRILGGRT